jgi:hypothetical protein
LRLSNASLAEKLNLLLTSQQPIELTQINKLGHPLMNKNKKACQRSPCGAKMWNSHIFLSFIMLI